MNLRELISLLSFSLILVFNSLFGQSNSNEYNFVSINEDITQSAITSIYKDSEGFIWITTYGDGIYSNDFNFTYGELKFIAPKEKIEYMNNITVKTRI